MKITNDLVERVHVEYSTILRGAERAETLDDCSNIINGYLNHLKENKSLNNNISVKMSPYGNILWYYKDELITIKTIQDLLCVNDENYTLFKSFVVENIDRDHFKEHLSVLSFIIEDENGVYLINKVKDRIKDIISEYQRAGLLDWALTITLHEENTKLKCVYTNSKGKDFILVINDLNELLDFKEDNFDYTENGIILNSKSDYSPLVVMNNNKLTVSGLLDCDDDGFVFIDGDEKIELSGIIEKFLEDSKVEYIDYDDSFDYDDWQHKYSVKIPNVSITIFNAPTKVSKDEILEYKILSSLGGILLDSEHYGYSEFTIEGFDITLFKLVGNDGEHDLNRILKLMNGQYVQFTMEVGVNNEK